MIKDIAHITSYRDAIGVPCIRALIVCHIISIQSGGNTGLCDASSAVVTVSSACASLSRFTKYSRQIASAKREQNA